MVDVFSEWAGPCNAMQNYLKKIKLEVFNTTDNENDNSYGAKLPKSGKLDKLKKNDNFFLKASIVIDFVHIL